MRYLLIIFVLSPLSLLTQYDITGIVVDSATQQPIANSYVQLRGLGMVTFTDASGIFSFGGSTPVIRQPHISPEVNVSGLVVSLSNFKNSSAGIYNIKGGRIQVLKVSENSHVEFKHHHPGLYILSVTTGGLSSNHKMLFFGNPLSIQFKLQSSESISNQKTASSHGNDDTIYVSTNHYYTKQTPVSMVDTVRIELSNLLDANGWTIFNESVDTRKIYISNNGNDSNAKATIAAGAALMRDGFPDWLHLERGSSWHEAIGTPWNKSGRLRNEPMVIRDYGSISIPRPIIDSIYSAQDSQGVAINFDNGTQYLAMVGIHTRGPGIDGHRVGYLLLENIDNEGNGFLFQSSDSLNPPHDITIRRCVIHESPGQGIFTDGVQNLTMEECIFVHNGLNSLSHNHNIYMSGLMASKSQGRAIPNGNIVRNCIIIQASGYNGIKWRMQNNSIIEHNVLSHNRATIQMQTKWPDEICVNNTIYENVIVEAGNESIDPVDTLLKKSTPYGIQVNGQKNSLIQGNIFSQTSPGLTGANGAIQITFSEREWDPSYTGIYLDLPQDMMIRNNIVSKWPGSLLSWAGQELNRTLPYSGIQVLNNMFQNPISGGQSTRRIITHGEPPRIGVSGAIYSDNSYYSPEEAIMWFRTETPSSWMTYTDWINLTGETGSTDQEVIYTDPNRTLGTYMQLLGLGSTFEDYRDAVLLQEKGNWNKDLEAMATINYIRAGFDLPALP